MKLWHHAPRMNGASPQSRPAARAAQPWGLVLIVGLGLTGLVFIPVAVDTFRHPKELLLRAMWMVAAALWVWRAVVRRGEFTQVLAPRGLVLLSGAAVAWVFVSTLLSRNRAASVEALLWLAASAMLFFEVRFRVVLARSTAIAVLLAVAGINAVAAMLQEFAGWNPFGFGDDVIGHARTIGFLGNPNDLGSYLALPTVLALVLADRANVVRSKALYAGLALMLAGGLVAAQTLTAVVAVGAGVIAHFAVTRGRASFKYAIASVVIVVLAIALAAPIRERLDGFAYLARTGKYNEIFSGRLLSFVSASEMFLDRPIFGVGPGAFSYEYMPYALRVQGEHPRLFRAAPQVNFGEVHNDHLEILAETGLPGLLLFWSAFWVLARRSNRETIDDDRGVAAAITIPAVVTIIVLALAQFPFQLAAHTAQMILVFAIASSRRVA